MTCQYCDVGEIEYDRDTKKAYNLDGSDHIHPKKEGKRNFTTKAAQPIEGELILLGKISTEQSRNDTQDEKIAKLEDEVKRQGEAIKALVREVSFKDGKGNKV